MRVMRFILALLICLSSLAAAQQSSGTNTTTRKKPPETSASGTGSVTNKKPTATSSSASTASKSKPKSTASSGNKATSTSKQTAADKNEKPKEEESRKESSTTTNEKTTSSSRIEGGEPKDGGSAAAKAKGTDNATTPPSKKTTTDSDELSEEEGTDERDPTKAGKRPAAVSSITPEEIEDFDSYPAATQQLIRRSLELTTQNLRYQFGSADPKAGGMDCSGTMYRVLQDSGIKDVPRQSDEMCRWVMRHTLLYRTEDTSTLKDKSLSALKPGDLLFWTGTYETSNPRELPISHVMLYLGKRKKDGKPVVFGASDGRTYDGQRRNGVSVFDFVMPRRDGKAAFYGYGPIPGLKGPATAGAPGQ